MKGVWFKVKKFKKFNFIFCFNFNNVLFRYFKCVIKFLMLVIGLEVRNDVKNLLKNLM